MDLEKDIELLDTESGVSTVDLKDEEITEESWYKFNGINDVFYTPFMSKKSWRYLQKNEDGTVTATPTAEQIITAMNKGHAVNTLAGSTNKIYFQKQIKKAAKTPVKLPAGAYMYRNNMRGEHLVPMTIRKDDNVVNLNNGISRVEEMLSNFLSKEELYKQHELPYRMGILAYGPPGSGKSISIRKLLNKVIQDCNAVAIYIDEWIPSIQFLEAVKNSCADRLKIFVFEEFTEFLSNPHQKRDAVLNFLDGELSCDKAITIATTNFPDKIPGNIKNRPGRFDQQICFTNPRLKDRELLFGHFLNRKITVDELEESKGLSAAAVKECCVDVLIRDRVLLDSIRETKRRIQESREFNKKKEETTTVEKIVDAAESVSKPLLNVLKPSSKNIFTKVAIEEDE